MSGAYGGDESLFRKYLKGWSFRSTTPTFEPDQEVAVFVTGVRDGVPVARVGDTVLEIPDAPPEMVDSRVAVRITDFDPDGHTGTAEFIEKVGESAF
jgi:hypothetical protein